MHYSNYQFLICCIDVLLPENSSCVFFVFILSESVSYVSPGKKDNKIFTLLNPLLTSAQTSLQYSHFSKRNHTNELQLCSIKHSSHCDPKVNFEFSRKRFSFGQSFQSSVWLDKDIQMCSQSPT